MRVERRVVEGVTVLAVADRVEVDVGNAEEFKLEVLGAAGGDRLLVLDASRVEFFDSAGLAALLSLQKRAAERQGKLALAGLNRAILEIFRMVGFDVILLCYPDVPKAVAAVKG